MVNFIWSERVQYIPQNIKFEKLFSTQYVKLVSKSTGKNSDVASVGEIDIFINK
jgi:hypothetical protein